MKQNKVKLLKARCTEAERAALLAIAATDGRGPSDALRQAIREAAERRGLIPVLEGFSNAKVE